MSRKVRHIYARPDEWIVVHRPKQSQSDAAGCLGFVIIILVISAFLHSC